MPDKRVSVYVDGFNLYRALDALGEDHLKWLNLWALSETLVRDGEIVTAVKYFSAYAKWKPDSYRRQQRFAALQAYGVELNRRTFQEKNIAVSGLQQALHDT